MPASTASANSSHISLPGSLSSALSWTFNRWSTGSSSSSTWGTSSTSLHPENAYSSHRSSYPPSQPSSRPPSRRRASPFQPPPLPPLSLQGYSSSTSSHLLTPTLAEEIRQLIPARLQLYDSWTLVYSLEQHGVSLTTLYERCSNREFAKGGFVLVIKDDAGGVFGAFVNEGFRVSGGRYYGTGECFLWKSGWVKSYKSVHAQGNGSAAGNNNLLHHHHHHHQHHHHHVHLHHHQNESRKPNGEEKEENLINMEIEPLSEKTRNIDDEQRPYSSSSRVGTPVSIASSTTTNNENVLKFKAFPYSGVNEYFILCEQGFLSVGGGNGKFGLWLDNNFEKGVSSTCPTFGNEPLSEDGEKFEIIGVELWSIGGAF